MTDQEMNVAIAEALGEKLFIIHKPCHDPFGYYRKNACGYTNNINEAWRVAEAEAKKHVWGDSNTIDRVAAVPAPTLDYCNDLNAMHEAEKSLMLGKAVRYRLNLQSLSDGANAKFASAEAALCHANARQRAEAYLRTIGKWKD